jgi:hypothetical protein
MAQAAANTLVSDHDFLETLATRRCLLAPPWVLQLRGDGQAERLMPIAYDEHENMLKSEILVRVLGLPPHGRARLARPAHEAEPH